MGVTVKNFGKTTAGVETQLYMIENKNGMKAGVTNFGAILVNLFVKGADGSTCVAADIGYGGVIKAFGGKQLLGGSQKLIHFRLSKLGLRDVNSLDVKATVFHFLHFPPFVYKLSSWPSVYELKNLLLIIPFWTPFCKSFVQNYYEMLTKIFFFITFA